MDVAVSEMPDACHTRWANLTFIAAVKMFGSLFYRVSATTTHKHVEAQLSHQEEEEDSYFDYSDDDEMMMMMVMMMVLTS